MFVSLWSGLHLSLLLAHTVHALVKGENDYSCTSKTQSNPVILIHGLFCNADYMDAIASYLQSRGFCTYATTYGANPGNPDIGGLKSIQDSAAVLADFISSVKNKTGAAKVNLVGHSEGALMTLYVPKFETAITSLVDKVVAIAPPTHGTTLSGIATLIGALESKTATKVRASIKVSGCPACTDVVRGGPAVTALDDGPIAQPGIAYHIITSRHDEIVTPPSTAFVNESNVSNSYIQDRCPLDVTGHLAEPFDANVIQYVAHSLDARLAPSVICDIGGAPLRS